MSRLVKLEDALFLYVNSGPVKKACTSPLAKIMTF